MCKIKDEIINGTYPDSATRTEPKRPVALFQRGNVDDIIVEYSAPDSRYGSGYYITSKVKLPYDDYDN